MKLGLKLFAFISFMMFYGSLFSQQSSTSVQPVMTFDKETHDLKDVKKDTKVSYTFEFKNTGSQPLLIMDVISSCECTIPTWSKQPVMPGQKGKIKVTYKADSLGLVNKQITVRSNAENSPVMLKLKGMVVPNE